MKPDYIIWLNRQGNQFKKVIRSPHSLSQAIQQYVSNLPDNVMPESMTTLRYEIVQPHDVFA